MRLRRSRLALRVREREAPERSMTSDDLYRCTPVCEKKVCV
jgi:hypothetical protein